MHRLRRDCPWGLFGMLAAVELPDRRGRVAKGEPCGGPGVRAIVREGLAAPATRIRPERSYVVVAISTAASVP